MTDPISIHVPGSSGSCRAGADWLDKFAVGALDASGMATAALRTANAGWWGPASGRFQEIAVDPRNVCDDLELTCSTAANALRDFADGLDKVNEKINLAVDLAKVGKLETTAVEIVPPDRGKIITSSHPKKPANADASAMGEYNDAVLEYNEQVTEYNAKVAVFNECGTIVKEARILEDETHAALESGLPAHSECRAGAKGGGPAFDGWKVGGTVASMALDGLDGAPNARLEAVQRASELDRDARMFTQLATAKRYSDFKPSAEELAKLKESARDSGLTRDRQLALIRNYERKFPDFLRTSEKWVALGTPARRAATVKVRDGYRGKNPGKAFATAAGVLLTVFDENGKLERGEQTELGTAVKSIGLVAAGSIGATIGAAAGGVPAGIPGAIIGSQVFQEQADKFIEWAMPRDFDIQYNQPLAEKAERA